MKKLLLTMLLLITACKEDLTIDIDIQEEIAKGVLAEIANWCGQIHTVIQMHDSGEYSYDGEQLLLTVNQLKEDFQTRKVDPELHLAKVKQYQSTRAAEMKSLEEYVNRAADNWMETTINWKIVSGFEGQIAAEKRQEAREIYSRARKRQDEETRILNQWAYDAVCTAGAGQ